MPKKTFDRWCEKAQKHATSLNLPDGLWDEDDPYDLLEAAKAAYEEGRDPDEFVREIFADELASMEYDRLMSEEAEEYAELDYEIKEEE